MRIGSLFSGYGGLDLAVQSVLGGELAFVSDIEPAACRVLEAHHPGVPNIGDITAVEWQYVKHDHGPIDVITAGYPCQPFSTAGLRKGTNDERHLWPYVRRAIRVLRPGIVVLENVRDHLALGFDVVLADLAELGMSARWGTVRASDAGAPHQRARLFIVVADPDQSGPQGADAGLDVAAGWSDAGGHATQGDHIAAADADGGRKRVNTRVTPSSQAGPHAGDGPHGAGGAWTDWSKYATAIHRWERVLGRPAPSPTIPGANGRPRLSPAFVEWMMGLPEGHVTGHGLRPAQELKMLGNGVVPQQAALALRMLLGLPWTASPNDAVIGTPQAGLGEGGGVRSPRFRGNNAPTVQELVREMGWVQP